jgi:hypothetical protein
MSVGAINMANRGSVGKETSSKNSFRWVHVDSYQRRSLVPVR